jgi:hypothetical protein
VYICKIVEENDEDSASYFGPFPTNIECTTFGEKYIRSDDFEDTKVAFESLPLTSPNDV